MTKKKPQFETKLPRTDEAEETLRAIRNGTVDAFLIQELEGHRVYTLEGADLPYSILVGRMQQGAAMLNARGEIVYCNSSLAQLLGVPQPTVIGITLQNFLAGADHTAYQKLLHETQLGSSEGEMRLRRPDAGLISAHFSFKLLSRDASAIGVLITDLTAQKQHADLTARLQQMQDEEHRRIARELHDSVGQLLVALVMNISNIKKEAYKLSAEASKLIDDNNAMINEITHEIRTISHLLHPPLLDEVGLPSALRWYVEGFAQRSKIDTILEIPENLPRLPPDVEIAIFRAVQECLTNIHRHSRSASCSVTIVEDENRLCVEIRDSGVGIPQHKLLTLTSLGGVGLRGMRERLCQLGGRLEIDSSESGTTVRASLPISWARGASSDVA